MDIVDVAENAFGLFEPLGTASREVADDLILVDQEGAWDFRMALRLRFGADELDERVAAVRAWFRDRGREDFSWWIGSGSTPGLADALLARGAKPDPGSDLVPMVLDEEPPRVDRVDVREIETFEDELVARRMLIEAFGTSEDALPSVDELRRRWQDRRRLGGSAGFLAFVDGDPVARAVAVQTDPGPVQLIGGAVRPEFRGRGLYRALLRARWDWAAARGTPVLVTQAGPMSRPILERTGFRAVGSLTILRDRT